MGRFATCVHTQQGAWCRYCGYFSPVNHTPECLGLFGLMGCRCPKGKESNVAEINVGDKYYHHGLGRTLEVKYIGKTSAFVEDAHGNELRYLLSTLRNAEKIEPFFEAGKTYRDRRDGEVFEVEFISEKHGTKVAYGYVKFPGDSEWLTFARVPDQFKYYEEVRDAE